MFSAVHIFLESPKIILNLIFHIIVSMNIQQHIVSLLPTLTTYSSSNKVISESSRSSVFLSSWTSSSGHTGEVTIPGFWTCDRAQTAHHIWISTIISYLSVTQQVSCVFCSYQILMNTVLWQVYASRHTLVKSHSINTVVLWINMIQWTNLNVTYWRFKTWIEAPGVTSGIWRSVWSKHTLLFMLKQICIDYWTFAALLYLFTFSVKTRPFAVA